MPKAPLRKPIAPVDMKKLEEFATEGEEVSKPKPPIKAKVKTIRKPKYPWEEKGIRSDVIKGMGVPLTEPHLIKLQFIAKHTKWSQRKFCQIKLEKAIDHEITAILDSNTFTKPD
jgi:hypothetical protein